MGGVPRELPKKFSGEKIAFAAQQFYTKIKFPFFVVIGRRAYKI